MKNVSIRGLLASEDEEADRLLNLAFQTSINRLNDTRFFRSLQPDGWFGAFYNDRLIGTVGAISYDTIAHVGFMTVDPELQGQGIGRMLMEHLLDWLESQHVPMVTLDASKMGRPMYLKLGFIDFDETSTLERQIDPVADALPKGVQPVTLHDLDELTELDAPIFGADRRKVFQKMLELYPSRGFLHRNQDGKITGYLFAHMNRIGPWVMLDPDHSEALFQAALTLKYENPVSICVPLINQYAVDFLQARGFNWVRTGKHMSRGNGRVPGQRASVFAQTSMGAG